MRLFLYHQKKLLGDIFFKLREFFLELAFYFFLILRCFFINYFLFYAFIIIFLILTFCFFFPYSELLSPKPVNLNVVKFYFISCFLLLFIYFFSDLIKFDFIGYFYNFLLFSPYFTLIFVIPLVRRYAQKNLNSRLLISFLRLSSLLVIILVSKNIFLYFYFL